MYLKSQTHSSRTFLSPFPSPLERKHTEAISSEDAAASGLDFFFFFFFFSCVLLAKRILGVHPPAGSSMKRHRHHQHRDTKEKESEVKL